MSLQNKIILGDCLEKMKGIPEQEKKKVPFCTCSYCKSNKPHEVHII